MREGGGGPGSDRAGGEGGAGPPARPGVAWVTGASSGLGEEIAVALARQGRPVALSARRTEELERVQERIRGEGGLGAVVPCDVGDRSEVARAGAEVEETLGPVELLVANAGISRDTPIQELDAGAVEEVFRVNVMGMVYAVEAVLPGMLRRKNGHLVGISSVAGFRGLPRRPAYSASKAAMTAFLEGVRVDLQGTGVDVTVVSPGWVRTPLTERNRHPMPFLMEVDEAVRIILRGVEGRRRHVAFPWPLVAAVRLLRILPAGIYDRIGGWASRKAP